jgi:exopolyphosphatase/guanosine-5'-triphosphate,3'-diphosphate pyrophosphatase
MYACIDLGSNSFHLLIGEWADGRVQLVERCSEKVQLGEGVQTSGRITTGAFRRGLDCLRHFQALIDLHGVERYWALGTNTFRIAGNADDFLKAAAAIGLEISIISGVQEAVLIYAGVISGLPASEDQRLVIDIGGGSTELIVGQGHQRLITHSLPIGCVSWRDRFFEGQGNLDLSTLEAILQQAGETACALFRQVAPGINHYHWQAAYASSGTAKMLTLICQEQGLGNGEITLTALQQLRPLMLEAIVSGQLLPGLKEKRRDLLLPGYAVMSGLMQALSCERIVFSPTALREGMMDFIARSGRAVPSLDPAKLPEVSYAGS